MYYEKAKDIIYLRYNNIIEKWIKKEGITDNLIDEKSNIFIFWWQGINNAPKIIKGCINTIYENSGLHKVVILDKNGGMKRLEKASAIYLNSFIFLSIKHKKSN